MKWKICSGHQIPPTKENKGAASNKKQDKKCASKRLGQPAQGEGNVTNKTNYI